MKTKKITFLLLFIGIVSVQTQAQTPYFYYYGGEKQYYELDTRHVFVSVADENATKTFIWESANHQNWAVDVAEHSHSKAKSQRYWTKLSLDRRLSDEAF